MKPTRAKNAMQTCPAKLAISSSASLSTKSVLPCMKTWCSVVYKELTQNLGITNPKFQVSKLEN